MLVGSAPSSGGALPSHVLPQTETNSCFRSNLPNQNQDKPSSIDAFPSWRKHERLRGKNASGTTLRSSIRAECFSRYRWFMVRKSIVA